MNFIKATCAWEAFCAHSTAKKAAILGLIIESQKKDPEVFGY